MIKIPSWVCPYCNKEMYSSWTSLEDEIVVCIHCAGTFKNKYSEELKLRSDDICSTERSLIEEQKL